MSIAVADNLYVCLRAGLKFINQSQGFVRSAGALGRAKSPQIGPDRLTRPASMLCAEQSKGEPRAALALLEHTWQHCKGEAAAAAVSPRGI